jgi:hypothetical protein
MSEQLQLAIPTADASPQDLTDFAKFHLETMRDETERASEIAQIAAHRAWAIGKACVTLKEKVGEDQWEEYATQNIGDYFPIYRCMRLARMSPDKPPLRGSAQYKQLQIAFGNEPPPKTTPRKTDVHKFSNFKAAVTAIRRWWREGDGIKGLDNESLREIRDDLKPIVDIYENIQLRLGEE